MRIFSELELGDEPLHRIGGKDLCALLDISSGALTDLKKRDIAVHLAHDSYDLVETVRRYTATFAARLLAGGIRTRCRSSQPKKPASPRNRRMLKR